jgi:protein gp37
MGENSAIAWTDHTFNPWWGCSRVSPGCENCYAETLATVRRKLPVWGVDAERKPMSEAYWREPLKWNRKAAAEGVRRRVFCASMADVFETPPERNEQAWTVMQSARVRLWRLIEETPALDWLLLTKRPQNITQLAPWASPRKAMAKVWPSNVWLGTTAEDQQRYDERWSILSRVPAAVRFVSHEPALGPIVLRSFSGFVGRDQPDWVITGGESGPRARPYDLAWGRGVVEQCRAFGIAAFVKQLGADPIDGAAGCEVMQRHAKGGDPAEWPEELRVQQFPRSAS